MKKRGRRVASMIFGSTRSFASTHWRTSCVTSVGYADGAYGREKSMGSLVAGGRRVRVKSSYAMKYSPASGTGGMPSASVTPLTGWRSEIAWRPSAWRRGTAALFWGVTPRLKYVSMATA
jgi:hypothetical protein